VPAAEEVKSPQVDLPLGIGMSLCLCAALFMSVAAVLVGLVPFNEIDADTPMSDAFDRYNLPWAKSSSLGEHSWPSPLHSSAASSIPRYAVTTHLHCCLLATLDGKPLLCTDPWAQDLVTGGALMAPSTTLLGSILPQVRCQALTYLWENVIIVIIVMIVIIVIRYSHFRCAQASARRQYNLWRQ